MIDDRYKETYNRIFLSLLLKAETGGFDECGLPSYTHQNRLMSWLFWQRIRIAAKMIDVTRGNNVFDFGCGAGVIFQHLHDLGCRITGCDIEFHEIAARVAEGLNIPARIFRDISELHDEKFDFILALDVLEHVEDVDCILEQFKRIGTPRTRVIVSGPTENRLYRFGRFLAGFSGHYHVRNIYDVERSLKEAGFRRLSVRRLYFPVTLFRVSQWAPDPDSQ